MLVVLVEYFLNGIDPNLCETGLYIHVCLVSLSNNPMHTQSKQL